MGGDPTPVVPRLEAVEVDVNQELSRHWGVIHDFLTRFMTFQGVDETVAEEIAILPGMEELLSLLRVKRFADSGRYDLIVIDCAPTGDTVRMLGVPEVLNFYFSRIFPIQRTVLRTVRPVAQRDHRHAHPHRRRVRGGEGAARADGRDGPASSRIPSRARSGSS